MADNFYNVLGVNEKSTKEEIKKAYRSLQMKYHPDKSNGNEESAIMSRKINEAYEILGDDQKKQEYDNTRNNPNPFMRMNSKGGSGDPHMEDILNMFFGGNSGNPFGPPFGNPFGMPPGAKVHVFHGNPMGFQQAISTPPPIMKTVTITMAQVLSGTTIPIDIERWVIENGIKVHENENIYVTIPQGIDENEMLILREKGNIISENVKGDVKVCIKINNETEFKRSGLDLILEKKISLKEALCGFTIELNYLNGKSYTLNNNKGNIIPPEYRKIYPGMGLTRGEHKGNMIIHFHIEFPEKLTDEQLEKLSNTL